MNKIQKKWILLAGVFLAAGLCAAYGWYMIFAREHPQPGAFSVQVVLTLVIGSLLLLVMEYRKNLSSDGTVAGSVVYDGTPCIFKTR